MKSQIINLYHKVGGFKKFWATMFAANYILLSVFLVISSLFVELHNISLLETIICSSICASLAFAGVCTYETIKLGKKCPKLDNEEKN